MSAPIPLATQQGLLPLLGVLVECLDGNQREINGAVASGFLRREADGCYLYTCWHVVTGFDPNAIRIGAQLPNRRFVRVSLQKTTTFPGGQSIGGFQTFTLPLYQEEQPPFRPLWFQDDRHTPQADLNSIGLYVPFWHDVVKLRIPTGLPVSEIQLVRDECTFPGNVGLLAPGDKCMVVGFPYGFSASGSTQPTPVVLTRFIAADRIVGRHRQLLLESIAAPGMSGAPVFVERNENLLMFGIYTGAVFPDHLREAPERATGLGVVNDLSLLFWHHRPMVSMPSQAPES